MRALSLALTPHWATPIRPLLPAVKALNYSERESESAAGRAQVGLSHALRARSLALTPHRATPIRPLLPAAKALNPSIRKSELVSCRRALIAGRRLRLYVEITFLDSAPFCTGFEWALIYIDQDGRQALVQPSWVVLRFFT